MTLCDSTSKNAVDEVDGGRVIMYTFEESSDAVLENGLVEVGDLATAAMDGGIVRMQPGFYSTTKVEVKLGEECARKGLEVIVMFIYDSVAKMVFVVEFVDGLLK
jgi:hypothetical protein